MSKTNVSWIGEAKLVRLIAELTRLKEIDEATLPECRESIASNQEDVQSRKANQEEV